VPGGVTPTGTSGAEPEAVVPGGVAPKRKKPALDPKNPYEPITSPFPVHVRACRFETKNIAPRSMARIRNCFLFVMG